MVGGAGLKPAFAKRDKKQTTIDLWRIPTNLSKNQLCPSIRLSRLGSKVRDGKMNSCIYPLFQVSPVWLRLTAAFILLGLACVAEINTCMHSIPLCDSPA
jgi:hypothetical protein